MHESYTYYYFHARYNQNMISCYDHNENQSNKSIWNITLPNVVLANPMSQNSIPNGKEGDTEVSTRNNVNQFWQRLCQIRRGDLQESQNTSKTAKEFLTANFLSKKLTTNVDDGARANFLSQGQGLCKQGLWQYTHRKNYSYVISYILHFPKILFILRILILYQCANGIV